MTQTELQQRFDVVFGEWETALSNATPETLKKRETPESWTMAQLFNHLIITTERIFGAVNMIMAKGGNENEKKTERGEATFAKLAITEERVKSVTNPHPEEILDIDYLKKHFASIRERYTELLTNHDLSKYQGKMQHQLLGFLNPTEWMMFIEFHLRHHLRQKARIMAS